MTARTPEDLASNFARALNAGDIEALMACYEAGASLTPSPNATVVGAAAIREALGTFLALKPTMTLTSRILGRTADLALATSAWRLDGRAPDGAPVALSGTSIEVIRRQSDGRWLYAIDNPWGMALGG